MWLHLNLACFQGPRLFSWWLDPVAGLLNSGISWLLARPLLGSEKRKAGSTSYCNSSDWKLVLSQENPFFLVGRVNIQLRNWRSGGQFVMNELLRSFSVSPVPYLVLFARYFILAYSWSLAVLSIKWGDTELWRGLQSSQISGISDILWQQSSVVVSLGCLKGLEGMASLWKFPWRAQLRGFLGGKWLTVIQGSGLYQLRLR